MPLRADRTSRHARRIPNSNARLGSLNGKQPAAVRQTDYLEVNQIHHGDARQLMAGIAPESVSLSFWSPPYFVGKSYERGVTFGEWQELLSTVIRLHTPALKPGGFLVVNIADILCFS